MYCFIKLVIRWAHQVVCTIRRVINMDECWEWDDGNIKFLSTRMVWTMVEDAHESACEEKNAFFYSLPNLAILPSQISTSFSFRS